jgi:hypothetical protein
MLINLPICNIVLHFISTTTTTTTITTKPLISNSIAFYIYE